MGKNNTELSNYLSYGVDEKHRRIFFGDLDSDDSGDFNHTTIEYVIRAIRRMESSAPNTPIEIHMNSMGGDPYSMLYLYDVIQACRCKIIFFGGGSIMSAATWIMAGCDERYLYPNATVMVHNGSESMDGKFTDVQIGATESQRLQDLLEDIYAKNSKMNKTFWKEVCKRDLYLTAQEAIQLGLADKVVEPKKRGNLRQSRQHHLNREINQKEFRTLVNNLLQRIHIRAKIEVLVNDKVKEESDPDLVVKPLVIEEVSPPVAVKESNGSEKR